MADSSRPRYVPTKKRRQQQQRFHGAFTGGFSAGFFNTVGSREGWMPRSQQVDDDDDEVDDTALQLPVHDDGNSNYMNAATAPTKKRQRPQQKLEDFMDEQDHDEWGGPTVVRKEYSSVDSGKFETTGTVQGSNSNGAATIEQWMKVSIEPPPNVGNRLLRVLGWREGRSTAYVPDKHDGKQQILGQNGDATDAKVILSSKKLRKVQLQQKRVKIPPPKLDTCGLGYEPYQNAPEFKAYQEKRRKLAHQRAKLGHSANVYRVSNVLGGDEEEDVASNTEKNGAKRRNVSSRQAQQPNKGGEDDDVYVSYETVEDFVGHKSVGGFALRDDEDDAFDDEPTTLTKASEKVRLDTEEYNNVVYEHSSDEEMNQIPAMGSFQKQAPASMTPAGSNDLAQVLSSFADTGGTMNDNSESAKSGGGGVTADGRKPLAGFVLGGASHNKPVRYPGPVVPQSFTVKRHKFAENEHPLVLKALSRAVQLEAVDQKRSQALDEALKANASSNAPSNRLQISNSSEAHQSVRSTAPMTGGAFVGLAKAMKNRFTSVTEGSTDANKLKGGLYIPSKSDKKDDENKNDTAIKNRSEINNDTAKTDIKLSRKTYLFTPHPLLCKRFHVPAPRAGAHNATGAPEGDARVTEESYFYQEIMNSAAGSFSAVPTQQDKQARDKKQSFVGTMFNEDGTLKAPEEPAGTTKEGEERPPMNVYKSIYEPQSDGTDSDSEEKDSNASASTAAKGGTEEESPTLRGQQASTYSQEAETQEKDHGNAGNKTRDKKPIANHGTSLVLYENRDTKRRKKHSKRKRRSCSHDKKEDPGEFSQDGNEFGNDSNGEKRRRSRSPSTDDSSDLSRDSYSSHERRKLKRRRNRDRKEKRRHKEKRKKKKKRSKEK